MSETTSVSKSSPKKKAAAPKKPADHPKYADMIQAAIAALKERSGSSRQAICKYIVTNYKVGDNCNVHLRTALKRQVTSGTLVQVKGTGASGSFKLSEKAKKPVKKVKKPAAKKPSSAKKTPTKKKPTAKKPAAKKAAVAKKPAVAAKKSTKKTATPKKAKKPVAKKPAAKKAVKKTPKKKAAAKKSAKK